MLSSENVEALASAEEVVLVMHRDGHPEKRVPVWVVVVDGVPYLRSYKGVGSVWFRRALADARQAVEVGGQRLDATFQAIGDELEQPISEAFATKYARFSYADSMTAPIAVEATVRVS